MCGTKLFTQNKKRIVDADTNSKIIPPGYRNGI